MGLPWTPMGPTCPLGQGSYGLPPFSVRLVARGSMRLEGPFVAGPFKGGDLNPYGTSLPLGSGILRVATLFCKTCSYGVDGCRRLNFLRVSLNGISIDPLGGRDLTGCHPLL